MIAWGLWNGQFTPHQLANKAKDKGYKWLALELDDVQTGAYNQAIWPAVRQECLNVGIVPGVWFTEGANISQTPADAELAIAECEGPGDYNGIVQAITSNNLPLCSLAICTNFNVPLTTPAGAPDKDAAQILIDAGFSCLTECYLGDNITATPPELDWLGFRCGWPGTQAVAGVYNYPKAAYDQWNDWPLVDYLGENVL